MNIPFNVAQFLNEHVASAASKAGLDETFQPDIRPADPRFGHFQANGALAYAKRNKANPRDIATSISENLDIYSELVSATISGPGFITFKLSPKLLLNWLDTYTDESSFQAAAGSIYQGKRISIDYSSPNTAKQMHVGHIRSMIVGEAIQRMLRFCGADMIRDNHIGDWGTQFGIMILAIKHFKFNLDEEHEDALEDLEHIYREGNKLFESGEQYKEIARKELKMLQDGDPENVALWEKINKLSYDAFQKIYDIMNIEFDVVQGESFYNDKLEPVYKELEETGIARESDGALVIFFPNPNPKEKDYPFIIRKKDGASNYASTDLATAYYHSQINKVDEMVYVTDGRQQDHFKHLFLAAEQWFKAKGYRIPKFRHAWFGTILGEDGKAIKTRSGQSIKLKELLGEAVTRARAIVEEKNPELSEDEKSEIARIVGLGAVRYADLSQNRTSDYVFAWDKVLSFDGNTAPYLLYAVARIHSIFRKIGIEPTQEQHEATPFETEEEINLAYKLVEFPIILEQTIADLRPHTLCTYLFELAGKFSSFYNANKVITDDADIQARRLILCSRTLAILETGLHLLGLETLKKM